MTKNNGNKNKTKVRVKVLGLVTTFDENSSGDLYLVRLTFRDDDNKLIHQNISVVLVNNVTVKSYIRSEYNINLVNIHWNNILTKILKYKGFK